MTIEKRIVEAPYMTSALRREAAEEITRLRNALAQIVKIGAEHRDGRLKALEWVAALESRLREIGDLAASCRTGPALREAMAQIETMTDMRHNPLYAAPPAGPRRDPLRGALKTVIYELAALIPNPDKTLVDDWPCENAADRQCLQIAYTTAREALHGIGGSDAE